MEKTVRARVQHKHDIEANWLKATNFTPLASEIIVYDLDENYDYPRIKIGDGKTNINDLPFIVDEAKITEIISNSLEDAKNSGEFDGKDGQDGISTSLTIKYARSTSNSTEPDTWQDSIPTLTSTEKYLWAQFTKTEGPSSSVWTGVVGAYGDKGDKGDPGTSGVDGEDGYTPVKGTDYFTEADKQEIAEQAASMVEIPDSADYVVQDTAPTDTSVLWVDMSDDSNDGFQDAVNLALAQAKASGEFKGDPGTPGKDGKDGKNGTSVYIMEITESEVGNGPNIVEFSDGNTLTVRNGRPGNNGTSATHSWNGTTLTITSASGTSFADLKGAKGDKGDKGDTGATGSSGKDGKDGKTPVKGVDYFTEADKEEILSELKAEQTGMLEIPLTEQGYMEGGNGWNNFTTSVETSRNSGYVEIPEGYTHIKATLRINKYGWAVLFATGNGSGLILDSSISALGGEDNTTRDYFVPIPSNAQYVMVSAYFFENCSAYFANEEQTEEETPTDILDGTEFALFKQWGIVGDSLSVGHTADSDGNASSPNLDYSWGQYLARRIGNTCLNFGRSGVSAKAWMTDAKGYNLLIQPEQLCQCYILALGANDADYTLGSIADVDFANMNNNADTEYGWYAKVINAIRTTAPQAPIFLFTLPHPRNTDPAIKAINGMIREFASNENFQMVYLVDLDTDYNDYFKEGKLGNCIGNTGWHLTALGYLYASVVNEVAISKVMAEHPGDFQNVFEIPYGEAEENTPTDGEDGVGIASIKQTTTSSADGGNNILTITLTNGESTTFTVKNGSKGSTGDKGDTGPAYTLTSTDKSSIAAAVKASLTTETWTFELEGGSTVTKAVLLG